MKDIYQFTEEELQQLLYEQKRLAVKDNIMYLGVSLNGIPLPDYSKFKVEENEAVEFAIWIKDNDWKLINELWENMVDNTLNSSTTEELYQLFKNRNK